jgi:hypothetical protein
VIRYENPIPFCGDKIGSGLICSTANLFQFIDVIKCVILLIDLCVPTRHINGCFSFDYLLNNDQIVAKYKLSTCSGYIMNEMAIYQNIRGVNGWFMKLPITNPPILGILKWDSRVRQWCSWIRLWSAAVTGIVGCIMGGDHVNLGGPKTLINRLHNATQNPA